MFSVNKLREEWAFAVWIGIFVLVLAFGLFGHYMVEPRGYKWNFWNYWEVGALGSTIVFNVLFYILGFFLPPKMFLSLKNPSFIGVVVIFELISIGCLGWATYISLEERSCLLQLLAMLIVAMSFWALDSVMAHQSKNTDIGNDFRATVRLSDAPALVAFGVLFVFSLFQHDSAAETTKVTEFSPAFRAFVGGAITFQMIASNWVLALIFRRPGEPVGTAGTEEDPSIARMKQMITFMKARNKNVITLLVAVSILCSWALWRLYSRNKTTGTVDAGQGLLGRPLRVGVVSWPGYAGGIVANNGFKPNKGCIFWNKHKMVVEFVLLEDVDARAKAFARGGEGGIDIMWSTVDFWANELPGFINTGVKARAVMQVDWSRGGDAIVADKSIIRIEDLKGKKISLALFTPSHWLLEYSLENSGLNEAEQNQIVKSLVGKNASPDARADFVANKVDAAVVWEPDVTEALQKRPGSHILTSSKTATNIIADIMVVREDFISQHPDVIRAFILGWFDGTDEANRKHDLVVKLLMENEALYNNLGEQLTREGLASVKWADLADNTKMFGLDGSEPVFDRIFTQASKAWIKRGYINREVMPIQAKDDQFLREIYRSTPTAVRPDSPK